MSVVDKEFLYDRKLVFVLVYNGWKAVECAG
jgi:hypothetical protein